MRTHSKTHSSKSGKRILSVTIRHILDENPNMSYLGEYSNSATSEFSIDRAHDEDCAINTGKPAEVPAHTLYECGSCDSLHQWKFSGDCREDANRYASVDDYAERNNVPESTITVFSANERALADEGEFCDCSSENLPLREYRYFNPSFNYVTKDGKPSDGLTPEDVRKYTRQDYERMERLNRGDWGYIGIRADAEIGIGDVARYPKKFDVTCQRITSGGLWGIESDSDASYVAEVERDELADLKTQLLALGFSKRAIATAFKNVEHKDE